ncbi:MAG TPA: hypothetical protein VHX52_02255 [Steroidobacteraceae bacterium]|nr:hypothetical protein [Steroidobacteraceae bacterium]
MIEQQPSRGKEICCYKVHPYRLQKGVYTSGFDVIKVLTINAPGPRCSFRAFGCSPAALAHTCNPFLGNIARTCTVNAPDPVTDRAEGDDDTESSRHSGGAMLEALTARQLNTPVVLLRSHPQGGFEAFIALLPHYDLRPHAGLLLDRSGHSVPRSQRNEGAVPGA